MLIHLAADVGLLVMNVNTGTDDNTDSLHAKSLTTTVLTMYIDNVLKHDRLYI